MGRKEAWEADREVLRELPRPEKKNRLERAAFIDRLRKVVREESGEEEGEERGVMERSAGR